MQLRQRNEDFTAMNAEILAIAPDPVEVVAPLAKALKLPYPVLADPLQTVFKSYGLVQKNDIQGADFVVDAVGIVRYAYHSVTPDDRAPLTELLDVVKAAVK